MHVSQAGRGCCRFRMGGNTALVPLGRLSTSSAYVTPRDRGRRDSDQLHQQRTRKTFLIISNGHAKSWTFLIVAKYMRRLRINIGIEGILKAKITDTVYFSLTSSFTYPSANTGCHALHTFETVSLLYFAIRLGSYVSCIVLLVYCIASMDPDCFPTYALPSPWYNHQPSKHQTMPPPLCHIYLHVDLGSSCLPLAQICIQTPTVPKREPESN